jgi:GTP-binding protein Era
VRFPDDDELTSGENALDPALLAPTWPEGFRAGFVAVVGRPNAGKSTLTNALVGAKVAITSGRPETTRHAVRGVVHREDAQVVLVDTPGLHKPRTLLGERLNEMVHEALADVDAVVVCLPANEKVGPGDRTITRHAFGSRAPVVAAVTKSDTVTRGALVEKLIEVSQLGEFAAIVPVSGTTGAQVDELADVLAGLLPISPPLYPTGSLTDEPDHVMVAELVREAALEGVREELPHSLAVAVEEMVEREGRNGKRTLAVHVNLYVERDSQKAIIIGRGGSRLRDVGTRARREIEELLGRSVCLDLHVKVAKDWQRDPKQLGRLGF